MKIKRFLIVPFIILALIWNGTINTFAINTGFSTSPVTDDERNTILSNVTISLLLDEPRKDAIDCFDINEDGLLAICSKNLDQKYICVYEDDLFQYGYTFKDSGSIGIEWRNKNLMVYFVRGDIAIELDSNGNIVSIRKIENTIENNTYWREVVFSKKK